MMDLQSPTHESNRPVVTELPDSFDGDDSALMEKADKFRASRAINFPKAPLYNRLAAYPILGTPMGLLRIIYGVFKAIVGLAVAPFQKSLSVSKDGLLHVGRGVVEFFSLVTFPFLFKKNSTDEELAAKKMVFDRLAAPVKALRFDRQRLQRQVFSQMKAAVAVRKETHSDRNNGHTSSHQKSLHRRSGSYDVTFAQQGEPTTPTEFTVHSTHHQDD